jgi:hypothetical protein
VRLKESDAARTLHLITSDVHQLAKEFGWSSSHARAAQHYIVLVSVIAMRKRRQIPHDNEVRRAKLLHRCMPASVRQALCDELRFYF